MGIRLPKANTALQKYTNSDLANQAQNIHDGLLASAVAFPTPPISVITLQSLINTYITALADSIHGSKEQRADMHAARFQLRSALRLDALYVNEGIYTSIGSGMSYDAAKAVILATGYELSLDPSPIGPMPQPVVKKFSSPARGQLSILLVKIPGAKAYNLVIGLTGSTQVQTFSFPNTRILKEGLNPGQSYTFKLYATGASGIATETDPMTQVII